MVLQVTVESCQQAKITGRLKETEPDHCILKPSRWNLPKRQRQTFCSNIGTPSDRCKDGGAIPADIVIVRVFVSDTQCRLWKGRTGTKLRVKSTFIGVVM